MAAPAPKLKIEQEGDVGRETPSVATSGNVKEFAGRLLPLAERCLVADMGVLGGFLRGRHEAKLRKELDAAFREHPFDLASLPHWPEYTGWPIFEGTKVKGGHLEMKVQVIDWRWCSHGYELRADFTYWPNSFLHSAHSAGVGVYSYFDPSELRQLLAQASKPR